MTVELSISAQEISSERLNNVHKLQTRRLGTSSTSPGVWIGVGVAVLIILGSIAYFAWRRRSEGQEGKGVKQTDPTDEEANIENEESSVSENDTQSSISGGDQEAKPDGDQEAKQRTAPISTFRNTAQSTLDVHKCKSGFCEQCRKEREPGFLVVEKGEEPVRIVPAPKKGWWLEI